MPSPHTILLTGASGFIAKHIALQLLQSGYSVRGTLRSPAKAVEVRDALRPHLADPALLETALDFVTVDLLSDDGWDEAMDGVDALIHTASTFAVG